MSATWRRFLFDDRSYFAFQGFLESPCGTLKWIFFNSRFHFDFQRIFFFWSRSIQDCSQLLKDSLGLLRHIGLNSLQFSRKAKKNLRAHLEILCDPFKFLKFSQDS